MSEPASSTSILLSDWMPAAVERRPSMTSAAELRDQMLNRRTSSATEAQAMRERNVDANAF